MNANTSFDTTRAMPDPLLHPQTPDDSPGEQLLRHDPAADPGLANAFDGIAEGIIEIAMEVRALGLNDLEGDTGQQNTHREQITKLDKFSHETVARACAASLSIATLTSEEEKAAITFDRLLSRRYDAYVDPMDGSSNIDSNVGIGTIFSLYRSGAGLRPGREQVLAGYAIYGPATKLVYTAGKGVHIFTLDPRTRRLVVSAENVCMPSFGKFYSVNQAYQKKFQPGVRDFLDLLANGFDGRAYGLRYVGSLVADFHRTLIKGGIFLYPGPKLRHMYEACPLSWIVEAAGGLATNGDRPILDIIPSDRHETTPFFFGSPVEMLTLGKMMGGRTRPVSVVIVAQGEETCGRNGA